MTRIVDMKELKRALFSCLKEVSELVNDIYRSRDKFPWHYMDKDTDLFEAVVRVADHLKIDVSQAVPAKMALNEKKYPVKLCMDNMQKYTAYSEHTKIGKDLGQTIVVDWNDNKIELKAECNDMEALYRLCSSWSKATLEFSALRGFDKYENQMNVLFAMNGELSELNDIFLWMDTESNGEVITDEKWDKAAQEIADVILYYLKFWNCHV